MVTVSLLMGGGRAAVVLCDLHPSKVADGVDLVGLD